MYPALTEDGADAEGRAHRLKSMPRATTTDDRLGLRPLDEFEAGEEIGDFEGSSFGGVGAVRAIVADAGAEIVADGAGSGFFGVGGAHGVAPFEDGAFGFEDQDENFAGAHELAEFSEKGAGFVDGVKASCFAIRKDHGFNGNDAETGFVNARENFALLGACNGVRLDDRESAFECHERFLQNL